VLVLKEMLNRASRVVLVLKEMLNTQGGTYIFNYLLL